ncbi:MAG: CHAT domain-containing protein, partial [Moorea sp. SIO2B7]|nr:CHAT domain-containing protein [Moorena sp. SIO2B7]
MYNGENPCLSLAIARLTAAGAGNFAIWVLKAPYPGGYDFHNCTWYPALTKKWLAWQEMFQMQCQPHLPFIDTSHLPTQTSEIDANLASPGVGYGGRLMQDLGVSLWKWVFDGSIRNSLAQSRGIAIGQDKPLRLRLEIRDPNLISLPWEIMQPEAGKQAISLNQQILFSRTTSDVDPLMLYQGYQDALKILLVLGQPANLSSLEGEDLGNKSEQAKTPPPEALELQKEADTLTRVIEESSPLNLDHNQIATSISAHVDTLLQPTRAKLIEALDNGAYNVIFYAGHGVPAPDGGLLFLGVDSTINGTELAQVLVRNQVTLAVFNACWGA